MSSYDDAVRSWADEVHGHVRIAYQQAGYEGDRFTALEYLTEAREELVDQCSARFLDGFDRAIAVLQLDASLGDVTP